ncbi:MAG: hypothetical protein P4L84_34255 [Isosphaeraceae bacterium]|nr:hypothetical protein [Isosphaeraceae bacterium]
MTTLTSTPLVTTPVRVPRKIGLEFLVTQAARSGVANGMKLVYTPRLRRSNGAPKVMCPCDNGPNSCVTAVPLKNIRFRIEGWLLAELDAGQCPHCRRVYWG